MSDNVYTGAGMTGSDCSPYKVQNRVFDGKPTGGTFVNFIYYLKALKGTCLKTMNSLTNQLAGPPLNAFNDARRSQPTLRLALMLLELLLSRGTSYVFTMDDAFLAKAVDLGKSVEQTEEDDPDRGTEQYRAAIKHLLKVLTEITNLVEITKLLNDSTESSNAEFLSRFMGAQVLIDRRVPDLRVPDREVSRVPTFETPPTLGDYGTPDGASRVPDPAVDATFSRRPPSSSLPSLQFGSTAQRAMSQPRRFGTQPTSTQPTSTLQDLLQRAPSTGTAPDPPTSSTEVTPPPAPESKTQGQRTLPTPSREAQLAFLQVDSNRQRVKSIVEDKIAALAEQAAFACLHVTVNAVDHVSANDKTTRLRMKAKFESWSMNANDVDPTKAWNNLLALADEVNKVSPVNLPSWEVARQFETGFVAADTHNMNILRQIRMASKSLMPAPGDDNPRHLSNYIKQIEEISARLAAEELSKETNQRLTGTAMNSAASSPMLRQQTKTSSDFDWRLSKSIVRSRKTNNFYCLRCGKNIDDLTTSPCAKDNCTEKGNFKFPCPKCKSSDQEANHAMRNCPNAPARSKLSTNASSTKKKKKKKKKGQDPSPTPTPPTSTADKARNHAAQMFKLLTASEENGYQFNVVDSKDKAGNPQRSINMVPHSEHDHITVENEPSTSPSSSSSGLFSTINSSSAMFTMGSKVPRPKPITNGLRQALQLRDQQQTYFEDAPVTFGAEAAQGKPEFEFTFGTDDLKHVAATSLSFESEFTFGTDEHVPTAAISFSFASERSAALTSSAAPDTTGTRHSVPGTPMQHLACYTNTERIMIAAACDTGSYTTIVTTKALTDLKDHITISKWWTCKDVFLNGYSGTDQQRVKAFAVFTLYLDPAKTLPIRLESVIIDSSAYPLLIGLRDLENNKIVRDINNPDRMIHRASTSSTYWFLKSFAKDDWATQKNITPTPVPKSNNNYF